MNKHFSKAGIQIVNKHLKRSLSMKETKINYKTMLQTHRMGILKNNFIIAGLHVGKLKYLNTAVLWIKEMWNETITLEISWHYLR